MDIWTKLVYPKTLHQATKYFADPDIAHAFVARLRWPDEITCPQCGGREFSFIRADWRWHCISCKKRFSVKSGTIMEDSPLKLETWLLAMWLVVNAKNGISSYEIHRAVGVTQKTAWYLLHRIRELMRSTSLEPLFGVVEADETFVGGKEKNKHAHKKLNAGRGAVGKAIVLGLLERHGEVRVKHVPNTKKPTLQLEVRANVRAGSDVYTDSLLSYQGLDSDYA